MATPKEAFDLVSQRKEQLSKVFSEFESKKFSLGRIGTTWKDLEEHFKEIETCLDRTHEALKAQEKAFEDRKKSVESELKKRDADVNEKEQASVRRVQAQKDAAVATILEQKRKLADDKRKWDAEKQRAETANHDKVQTQKEKSRNKDSDTSKPISLKKDTHISKENEKKGIDTDFTKKSSGQIERAPIPLKMHKEPRSKLKSVFENMDHEGFKKLIIENQKELKALQEEVPSALKLCTDPAQFVLKTLETYMDIEKRAKQEFTKDESFACSMLLEPLIEIHGGNPVISDKAKKAAKEFSDKWKTMLKLDGQIGFNMFLIGRSFLQFVAAFGLTAEYEQDELFDIIAKVARRNQTASVFRSLGLSHKAPDIIERLKNDNKYLEALSFACEFNLMERFPPAPLIKLHIKEANKAVKNLSKSGTSSLAVKNEALQKELGALKAVASVVSEYKLENHYTLDYVNKRLETLEKTKAERKRAANASKSLQTSKRLRAGDSSPPGNRSGSPSPKKLLQGVHDREIYDVTHIPPYPGSSIPDLNPRPIGEYDRRPLGEYERRGVGDLERRQIEDIERRRLGLSNPAFAAAAAASSHPPHIPSNYGFPPLSLPSLGGFRSSVPNGQPGYGYSGWPSLGLGGFKPFL